VSCLEPVILNPNYVEDHSSRPTQSQKVREMPSQ
jgi:hypothetical protein